MSAPPAALASLLVIAPDGHSSMTSIRKWIIGALILAIIAGLFWRFSSRTHVLSEAYVADQSIILWNTLAQVRQRAGEAHWGDRVEILKRSGADTLVRTSSGVEGWMDGRALIDSAAWQREVDLQSKAHAIPIQATGHTKVFTNLRLDAGRDATRIYQLPGGVPLVIVGRAVVDVPAPPGGPGGASGSAAPAKNETPKREDWLLVYPLPARPAAPPSTGQGSQSSASPAQQAAPSDKSGPGASTGGSSSQAIQGDMVMGRDPAAQLRSGGVGVLKVPPLAGWVLSRFVELDLPETLRDYATSAGMHPVAWFVLNYASSDEAGGKPQYLMAGNHGASGGGGDAQPCDFNSLRIYTWGATRHRYETAFVEGNLCGYFPIRAAKQPHTGDPEFRFTALESNGAKLERVYAMHQTSVRRVREAETPTSKPPAKSKSSSQSKPPAPAKSPKHR
jgi:hypothetical protein